MLNRADAMRDPTGTKPAVGNGSFPLLTLPTSIPSDFCGILPSLLSLDLTLFSQWYPLSQWVWGLFI